MKNDQNILNLYEREGDTFIEVYVQPRSSKDKIAGIHDKSLKIALKAPPVDNEANESLIKFLSKLINVPKSDIEIIGGTKSRHKIVKIAGCKKEKIISDLKIETLQSKE